MSPAVYPSRIDSLLFHHTCTTTCYIYYIEKMHSITVCRRVIQRDFCHVLVWIDHALEFAQIMTRRASLFKVFPILFSLPS